mmetsp:Transcript_21467/g.47849  ORF Transcript_21467/g.47849 Transcript_21467/m.47849 type:complete len:202 (-) Transcript_21467:266-871(-)
MHRAAARQVRVDLPRHDLHLGVQHADRAQGREQGPLDLPGHASLGEGHPPVLGGREDCRLAVAWHPPHPPRRDSGHPWLRRTSAPLRRVQGAALQADHDAGGDELDVPPLRGEPRRPDDERPLGRQDQEGAGGPQVRVPQEAHLDQQVLDRGHERHGPRARLHRVQPDLRVPRQHEPDELPPELLVVLLRLPRSDGARLQH